MADPNARVREVLEELVAEGPEIGLQVAAYVDGELAVHAWAGLADVATRRPVDADTLFNVLASELVTHGGAA